MSYLKTVLATLGILAVIFVVLDFFNLTAWLVFPYSALTHKNKALTTQIGDTPSTNGG